jgi:hypothetical protein
MTDPLELIAAGIAALVEQDAHSLPDPSLLVSTEALLTSVNQLEGLITRQLQVMHVRDVTTAECGRKTRSWLVEDQHLGHENASRLMTVAKALPTHPVVHAALLAGDITLDHARNIVVSVSKVAEPLRELVEKELVEAARWVDPTALGHFARELRSRLDPAESAEAAEQRKYDDRWLTLTPTFQGMHRLDGMLDPACAAAVLTALGALSAKAGEIDERTVGQRRADALVTLALAALNTGTLPEVGGEKPHLIATIPYDQLKAKLQTAAGAGQPTLNGLPISPATARMLACDAGIIPAILGTAGEVLDLGRKTPLWSLPQRRALQLEDQGCRFPRCQVGLTHCQAHHEIHWAHGGHTDTTNGIHLCLYHHRLVHHTNWRIHKDRNNQIRVWRD